MSTTCLQFDKPSYQFKLFNTESVIRRAFTLFGEDCAVSWSGGKDSTLVLHLALKIWREMGFKTKLKVIFENTLVEFPETIYFIRKLTTLWNIDLIETRPIDGWTFRKILLLKGPPKCRQTNKQGKQRTPLCCIYLKEKPAMNALKKHGIKCLLTGVTTAESETRGYLKRYDHCGAEKDGLHFTQFYYYSTTWNCWKFNPIMNWTEKEVFDIHKRLSIPLNEVYTKWNRCYNRCGCLPCTAYKGWRRKLSRSHPKIYCWMLTFFRKKYTEPDIAVSYGTDTIRGKE